MSIIRCFVVFAAMSVAMLVCSGSAAGDEWPPVNQAELKMTSVSEAPGAPAVILYRQVDRIDNGKMASKEMEYVRIKILTDGGLKYGTVEIPFVKGREEISGVRARTIHADGSIVKFDGKIYESTIVKTKDVQYVAKVFSMPDVQRGSVIEYEVSHDFPKWETTFEGLGYVTDFMWVLSSELFTLQAKFSAKPYTEHGIDLKWSWPAGLPEGTKPPDRGVDGTIHLECKNIPALPIEDHMPPRSELMLRVVFTYSKSLPEGNPDKFWRDFNHKQYEAVEKFVGKSSAVQAAAKEMITDQDTPEAKLQKMYARVQKIRNLSYEFRKRPEERANQGIVENTSVDDVWTHGYGYKREIDWVFLTMTRAAGFEADAVLVSNRKQSFFNKARMQASEMGFTAVGVKTSNGELLLDPGGYLAPFGFLPWEETGVPALKLDKQDGTWFQTKLGSSETTQIRRQADLRLSADGSLEGKLTVVYSGQQAFAKRIDQMRADEAGRKAALEDEVKSYIPVTSQVELINQPDWTSAVPTLTAEFDIKVPGWAVMGAKHCTIAAGLFGNSEKGLFEHADRTNAIYFEYPYGLIDEIKISLPEGWKVEALPKPTTVDLKAAKFTFGSQGSETAIVLKRELRIEFVLMDRKFYPTVRSFFQTVQSEDGQQLTLQPSVSAAGV
jgi:Domain of Unknown Function with PDB structure (DUF3857)